MEPSEIEGDDTITGIDFLFNGVMPALNLLPVEERPLVVCYAPSNKDAIRNVRKRLEEGGIISFLKTEEDICVGLYSRIVCEYGYAPSYHDFVTHILGFTEEEMGMGKRGHSILFDLAVLKYDIYTSWLGESRDTVSGRAKLVEWDKIKADLSTGLGIQPEAFEVRITGLKPKYHIEGRPPGFKK